MMDMMWGMHGGMMVLAVLFWAVVFVAVAAAISWLVRHAHRGGAPALGVLRERYARGEISREEFEARRKDLAA